MRVVVDDADQVGEMEIVFVPKNQTSGRGRHEGVVHARRGRVVECWGPQSALFPGDGPGGGVECGGCA